MTQRQALLGVSLSDAGVLCRRASQPLLRRVQEPDDRGASRTGEFRNPHNLITLSLDEGTVYLADWINATRMASAGIIDAAKQAVVPGARIVVAGYRIRTAAELRTVAPKFKGDVNPNTVAARSLRRVDGSFTSDAERERGGPVNHHVIAHSHGGNVALYACGYRHFAEHLTKC